MKKQVEVIGFDADDTLWVNETYYRDVEKAYAGMLSDFADEETVNKELFKTEMQNLPLNGYGIKSFVISMIENAVRITDGAVPTETIARIIDLGKEMIMKPIELLPDVKDVLGELHGRYKLIVATKGDLLDQERKLQRSSLSRFFHHIEIMSDKQDENYQALLQHLEIAPEKFVMIGNSLRSDVLPPLNLGCHAIHVPYHTTWEHEMIDELPVNDRFNQVAGLMDVLAFFK